MIGTDRTHDELHHYLARSAVARRVLRYLRLAPTTVGAMATCMGRSRRTVRGAVLELRRMGVVRCCGLKSSGARIWTVNTQGGT